MLSLHTTPIAFGAYIMYILEVKMRSSIPELTLPSIHRRGLKMFRFVGHYTCADSCGSFLILELYYVIFVKTSPPLT